MNKTVFYIIGTLDRSADPGELPRLLVSPSPFRHGSFISAKLEAERLAQKSPGTRFVVLRTIGFAEVTATSWTDCDEEIPF